MSAAVVRWFYSALMWLVQPLLRAKLRRRSRLEPGYGQLIEERFGHYAAAVPAHNGPTVWIHAVSLGETRTAAVLLAQLRLQLPGMRLLLTHGTATGRAEGLKLLQGADLQAWQPWDSRAAVASFLAHFKPTIGILMETEVWPNLVHGCATRGVPLLLVNARLSDKSLRQALALGWLARPAFAALTAVWAQTEPDAQRLQTLGTPVAGVMGNLKFDAAVDANLLGRGKAWREQIGRPVLLLASAREGEEQALLDIIESFTPVAKAVSSPLAINSIVYQVQWLIVPRHPQRFEAVAELITSRGFILERRSAWGADGPTSVASATKPTIWLGDSLGEMALYYALADVALLGGSFEPLGGQNLIEAAACACPVVMGPHTFNFLHAAEQAQASGAALRAVDLKQAVQMAVALVAEPQRLLAARGATTNFALAHRGAARRLAVAIDEVLAASHRFDLDQTLS